jgi:hypothetical protein
MNPRAAISRREFLTATASAATVVAGGVAAYPPGLAAAVSAKKPGAWPRNVIDVNVTLGRWPFRRLRLDETPALVDKLLEHDVERAWAGTFDGLFHKNVAAANARLVAECRRHGRGVLVPFGSINPKLPDWEDDLRRCAETHKMAGVRLHPGYHGYRLDDPAFARLLSLARERRLVVQVVADMEDERMHHPLARVPHLDAKPLLGLLKSLPGAQVVLLNWFRSVSPPLVKELASAGVWFDIATVEGVGGLANLVQQIPVERVLFGSHAPLFYFESAMLKLQESALPVEQEHAVCGANARRLLRHP